MKTLPKADKREWHLVERTGHVNRQYEQTYDIMAGPEGQPAASYKAEKWTSIRGPGIPGHDVWAVVDDAGNPVAFGPETFIREYAGNLNANKGVIA